MGVVMVFGGLFFFFFIFVPFSPKIFCFGPRHVFTFFFFFKLMLFFFYSTSSRCLKSGIGGSFCLRKAASNELKKKLIALLHLFLILRT